MDPKKDGTKDTTVKLKPGTKRRLREQGSKGDTFDDIITVLINNIENKKTSANGVDRPTIHIFTEEEREEIINKIRRNVYTLAEINGELVVLKSGVIKEYESRHY